MRQSLTIDEQIEHLLNKGIKFDDLAIAKNILENHNYYNIINAYKGFFMDNNHLQYKENTNFNEVFEIYLFDQRLRSLFMHYFLIIENKIKTKLAYIISTNYSPYAYFNKSIFNLNKVPFMDCFDLIYNIYKKNINSDVIKHFISNNEQVPIWAFIDFFTLGNLRNFYLKCNQSIEDKLAIQFNLNSKQFISMICSINFFRNIAAHGNRFCLFKINDSNKQLKDLNLHNTLNLKKENQKYIYGKSDLFSIFLSLKYLLNKEDFNNLSDNLENLLDRISCQINTISIEDILEKMGFLIFDQNDNLIDWKQIKNLDIE